MRFGGLSGDCRMAGAKTLAMSFLQIFALNMPVTVRHTNLTRQQGLGPELPPLAEWLRTPELNLQKIELFPIKDLDDLSLPDYLSAAYDIAPEDLREAAPRLRALGGTVLLVPSAALSEAANPGPEATEIARLPLPEARHDAVLPKADIPRSPSATPVEEKSSKPLGTVSRTILVVVALVIAALVVLSLN